MKLRFDLRYLMLLLSVSFFFSCKKDDAPKPVIPEEKTPPSLFEQVKGKWSVNIKPVTRVSNPFTGKLSGYSAKTSFMPRVSSIEFFSDSTYLLSFEQYKAFTGKFSVKDSNTLKFTEFGDISDIKVSGDSISFSFTYLDIPLSVKAARFANVNVPADKKTLLKEWVLTREEDGAGYYENAGEDAEISCFFTLSGTYITKSPLGDGYSLYAKNWNWIPGKSNAIILYTGANTTGDYSEYIKIAELSSTSLTLQKIKIEKEYDADQNVIGTDEIVDETLIFTAK